MGLLPKDVEGLSFEADGESKSGAFALVELRFAPIERTIKIVLTSSGKARDQADT